MKKVLLAIAVIALIGCASCSKWKTCHCYYDYTNVISGEGTKDLGVYPTQGECSDLEDENSMFNFNFGTLGTGVVHCEQE
jgi:hypothetical protein